MTQAKVRDSRSAAYFPTLFPGELVYSILARLRRHTGSIPTSAFLTVFYGSNMPSQNIALPTRMAALAARIPASQGMSASKLIHDHTLFDYYSRFAAPANREVAFRRMLDGKGMARKQLRVSVSIPSPALLKVCPECQASMMTEHGELYWRREHQMPGVMICASHGCSMRYSTVHAGRHLAKLFAATSVTCPENSPAAVPPMSGSDRGSLGRLASDSVDILNGQDRFGLGNGEALEAYRRLLAEKGHMLSGGRVRSRAYSETAYREPRYLEPIWPRLFIEDGRCAD